MPGQPSLSAEQLLLTTLLFKLAVMAASATILVRFRRFRHFLISEDRPRRERLTFALSLGILLFFGVTARLALNYKAADLTLEGAFLAGLIDGPYAGVIVGVLVGLPALGAGELIALPFAVGCGFAGGGLRELCPKESIWHFSPFVFTSIHRRVWKMIRRVQVDWQVVLLLVPIFLELLRLALSARWRTRLFELWQSSPDPNLSPSSPWMLGAVLLITVIAVATPIKIWNNARIEHRLQEQEKLLLAARIEALANQINPHFLFNTLASISSLIRTQPETARMLITKLSGLLRRLMRSADHFVSLREELDSIDEYLDIEVIRFGPQLTVVKRISPDTLDVIVPSMILQPLVENSIKHGLARKVGGGRITISTMLRGGYTVIEVHDDGLGMSEERLERAFGGGIGLNNVNERLRTIYGEDCQLKLKSVPGQGTSASVEIPELTVAERVTA
jgi:two-component system LytT family sensor kinase